MRDGWWIERGRSAGALLCMALAGGVMSCGKEPNASVQQTYKFPYAYKVNLAGTLGTTPASQGLVVVGKGKLKVTNSLLYHTTGKPIAESFYQKEKPLLAIFVTSYEPADAEELTSKEKIHSQSYEESISFAIPDNYVNQKVSLFLTLVRTNSKAKKSEIVESVPLDFYVDTSGAGLQWVSGAQFVPAVKGAKIQLRTKAVLNGASLAGEPAAEYTVDGISWTSLPIAEWTQVAAGEFTFSVSYPLEDEQHFRLRLKARDTLGNESTSVASPNLVGRADLASALKVSASERSACKDAQQKPASHIDMVLASKVLCRARADDGSLLSETKVAIYVQNRGSVPLAFPVDVQTMTAAMVYSIGGKEDLRYFDIPHAPFSAADFTGTPKLVYLPVEQGRLASESIVLYFDRTLAGKYSTSGSITQGNTCYPAGESTPALQIQQAGALALIDPAVGCDE